MDLYTQALKVVAVKPPFGTDESSSHGAGASAGMASSSRAPPGMVKLSNPSFVDSSSNKRKHRARKTQKSSKKRSPGDDEEDEYGGQINPKHFWLQMEDYFREVTAEDMEVLLPLTNLSYTGQDPCFWFSPVAQVYAETTDEDEGQGADDADKFDDDADKVVDVAQQDSMRGLKRKLLIANDANKKKKKTLIPAEAELVTTVISPPDQDDEELCHVCNFGDSDDSNQILFCDSCSVAVHQECYGVSKVPAGQWLCSWCSNNSRRSHQYSKNRIAMVSEEPASVGEGSQSTQEFRCVLCTVNSGALKPVACADSVESSRRSGNRKFAHLFCCQWVPETYIHNIQVMEPIKNVEGIREERFRLVCMICKEKHGACIQCSHGLCAASFHPLCAREAKFWMEVSSREDSEEVELRAYCPKHSSARVSKPIEESDMISSGDEKQNLSIPETSSKRSEKLSSRDVAVQSKNRDISVVPFLENVKEQNSRKENQLKDEVLNEKENCWGADVLGQLENERKCSSVYSEKSEKVAMQVVEETSCKGFEIYPDLIKLFKKVIQRTHESPAAVALQAGVPLSALSMWLEGKMQTGSDNVNGSIRAWLSTQGLLADKMEGSKEPDQNAGHQETVYSQSRYKMDVSPKEESITSSLSHCVGKNGFSKLSVSGIHKRAQHPSAVLETRQQSGEDKASDTLDVSFPLQKAFQRPSSAGGVVEVCQDRSSSACHETFSTAQPKFVEMKAEDHKPGLEVLKECDFVPVIEKGGTMNALNSVPHCCSSAICDNNLEEIACMVPSTQNMADELQNEEKMLQGTQQNPEFSSLLDPACGSSASKANTKDLNFVLSALDTNLTADQGGVFARPNIFDEVNNFVKKEKQVDHASLKDDAVDDARQNMAKILVSSGTVVSQGENAGSTQIHPANPQPPIGNSRFYVEEDCEKELLQPFVHPYIVKRIGDLQQSTQAFLSFLTEQGVQRSMIHAENKSQTNDLLPASSFSPSCWKGSSHTRSVASDAMNDLFSGSLDIVEPPFVEIFALRSNYASSDQSGCLTSDSTRQSPMFTDLIDTQWEQFQRARDMHLLDSAPQDELEGELFCLQNQLISYAQANRFRSEQVIAKMIIHLPEERQASRHRQEDLALVNRYLADVREAKKQGRKKRKEKEAQAVLAAATAAAAASSRLGYVRRDALGSSMQANVHLSEDEAGLIHGENLTPSTLVLAVGNHTSPDSSRTHSGRPPLPKPQRFTVSTGQYSQRLPAYEKGSIEKPNSASQSSGLYQAPTGRSPANVKCDICSGSDSVHQNKIMTCELCKVAVHQECYGIGRNPVGAWYCQPCSEVNFQQRSFSIGEVKAQGSPDLGVQCALCPQTSGAFKRLTDGKWVHVFCAQWMPETTVGRDQTALIEGLGRVPSERFSMVCGICQHQHGACLKCNFGHCHGAFHASCARDAGLYLNVRSIAGGRVLYRAYCERHSPQQRAKAEIKHESSPDDLNAVKQIRVELERVRLICERISRRERLKRDLLHCTKDLCITELNAMAVSGSANVLENLGGSLAYKLSQPSIHANFEGGQQAGAWYPKNILNNVSRGTKISKVEDRHLVEARYPLWHKDNVPSIIPSRASVKSQLENTGSLTFKTRTPESFANVQPVAPADLSGVKDAGGFGPSLPGGPVAKRDAHSKSHKKQKRRSETLDREKVMTPIEASMHNRRLPKGYAYVPVDLLEKGTLSSEIPHQDAESQHLSDGKLPTS